MRDHGLAAQHQAMGVRGRQGARTYSSGFYFILIVFLFWGRLKGKKQFPIGPKRVRKRSVFFVLTPNMCCLPAISFLPSPFSYSLGALASHSTSHFTSSPDPYKGGFLKDEE